MHGPDIVVRAVVGLLAAYGALVVLWQAVVWTRRLLAPTRSAMSVSLLIYVRDQEHLIEGFLRTAIGSARAGHGEVIVVDTGSSDDTPAIVERLARRLSSLRLVRSTAGLPVPLLPPGRTAVVVDLQGSVDVHPVLCSLRILLGEGPGRRHRTVSSLPEA